MSKIDLNDVNSGYNRSAINANFQRIKDFLNDRVLMRNNVPGEPNTVITDIDFNGKRIYNLPAPSTSSEPARLQDLAGAIASGAILATATNDGLLSKEGFTKLAGIDDNATQNSPDLTLLNRSNHIGSQAISTVTGLQTAIDAKQDTLVSGTSIKTVNSTSLLGSGNINIAGVTSVAATVPTGLNVSGSPITTSGTLAVTWAATPTGTGANVFASSPALITPALGAATADSLLVNTAGSGLGFSAGAGGTVPQLTDKGTGVVLNKPSGSITMNAAALAANTTIYFTLSNTKIAAGDGLLLTADNSVNAASYNFWCSTGANLAYIFVRNITGGSLSEALVLNFQVVKGART